MKQAVIAGLGCSVMPLIGLKTELETGELRIIPIEGLPIETQWNLVWLKGKQFTPIAQAYFNFLEEQKASITHKHFDWYEKYTV